MQTRANETTQLLHIPERENLVQNKTGTENHRQTESGIMTLLHPNTIDLPS
jgi:hypothetical protein